MQIQLKIEPIEKNTAQEPRIYTLEGPEELKPELLSQPGVKPTKYKLPNELPKPVTVTFGKFSYKLIHGRRG